MADRTLEYYDRNASSFVENTLDADVHVLRDKFLKLIPAHGTILDFGCGSGRDTKEFLKLGYRVEATDGSRELCRAASEYAGIPVRHELFGELDKTGCYDGIWACSSILHVPSAELPDIFRRISSALKQGGILYTSFKFGTFEGVRSGRYFTDMTEEKLSDLMASVPELKVRELWITDDVRPGRENEKWMNLLAEKITS